MNTTANSNNNDKTVTLLYGLLMLDVCQISTLETSQNYNKFINQLQSIYCKKNQSRLNSSKLVVFLLYQHITISSTDLFSTIYSKYHKTNLSIYCKKSDFKPCATIPFIPTSKCIHLHWKSKAQLCNHIFTQFSDIIEFYMR